MKKVDSKPNQETITLGLSGVSTTLLLPLYSRATAPQYFPELGFHDEWAVWLLEQLDQTYTTAKDSQRLGSSLEAIVNSTIRDSIPMRRYITRSIILDRFANEFLACFPSSGVINLGCGLSTQAFRLDRFDSWWLDLDLPDVLTLRQQFIGEEPPIYQNCSASLFDIEAWLAVCPALKADVPVLVIIEGVLAYFSKEEVQAFLTHLAAVLPSYSQVLLDTISPIHAEFVNNNPVLIEANAQMQWSCESVGHLLQMTLPHWSVISFNPVVTMHEKTPDRGPHPSWPTTVDYHYAIAQLIRVVN